MLNLPLAFTVVKPSFHCYEICYEKCYDPDWKVLRKASLLRNGRGDRIPVLLHKTRHHS